MSSTIDLSEEYGLEIEADDPAVVARPIPEEPTDAELTLDTTDLTVAEAIEVVLTYLVESGWVEPNMK